MLFLQYLLSEYSLLPQEPGIYFFIGQNDEVLYVGKAKNLRKRVSSYLIQKDRILPKTKIMISQAKKIRVIVVQSEIESLLLEAVNIKNFSPRYNVTLKDGKSYPMIKINIKDEYPIILTVRKITDKKSQYFGPYPDAGSIRLVLRAIRRVFPFISTKFHPKKYCLYYHLGLCPCIPAQKNPDAGKEYKKTIRYIIKILSGNYQQVVKDLEKERNIYVKNEQFEKAQGVQRTIFAMQYITTPVKKPFEYEENPNLKTDLRGQELEELRLILGESGVKTKYLHRIECFDISTIQGINSTASMVVFIDGERDSSLYRRFKIRTSGTIGRPNDFAMMKEVLTRRFKHDGWEFPDLLIVDGGKGHVSVAQKVLAEKDLNIPLVGLAKRMETIITPDFKEINLSRSSNALKLAMRIRDEAHRFAVTYHRKLRSKI